MRDGGFVQVTATPYAPTYGVKFCVQWWDLNSLPTGAIGKVDTSPVSARIPALVLRLFERNKLN